MVKDTVLCVCTCSPHLYDPDTVVSDIESTFCGDVVDGQEGQVAPVTGEGGNVLLHILDHAHSNNKSPS